jgi:hypothetical protein
MEAGEGKLMLRERRDSAKGARSKSPLASILLPDLLLLLLFLRIVARRHETEL